MELPIQDARLRAAEKGEKIYDGTACKQGHDGRRYTVSGNCVECTKLASKARHDRIRRLLAANA